MSSLILAPQAVCYLDEYNEMLDFIVRWSEKAKSLLRANIIWNSSVHLQEQIRMYQVSWGSRQASSWFLLWYSATDSLAFQKVLLSSLPSSVLFREGKIEMDDMVWVSLSMHSSQTCQNIYPWTPFMKGTCCREWTISSHQETIPHVSHSLPCCPVLRLSFVSLGSSMETWNRWQRKWSFCRMCCRSSLWASRFVNSAGTLRSFSKASRHDCRAWKMQIR